MSKFVMLFVVLFLLSTPVWAEGNGTLPADEALPQPAPTVAAPAPGPAVTPAAPAGNPRTSPYYPVGAQHPCPKYVPGHVVDSPGYNRHHGGGRPIVINRGTTVVRPVTIIRESLSAADKAKLDQASKDAAAALKAANAAQVTADGATNDVKHVATGVRQNRARLDAHDKEIEAQKAKISKVGLIAMGGLAAGSFLLFAAIAAGLVFGAVVIKRRRAAVGGTP